jgi:hypothetical protein
MLSKQKNQTHNIRDIDRENVPDNPLLVYYVGNPTREKTEGIGNIIEPSDLFSFIAEQSEGQIVLLCETLV